MYSTFYKYRASRLLFFVLIASSLSFKLQGQQIYSLKTCVEKAIKENISVKQAVLNAKLTALSYKQVDLEKYPTANAGLNNGLNFGRSINPTTNQFETNTIFFTGLGLSSNVELFNWFRRKHQLAAAALDTKAAIAQTEKIGNDIALNVALAYLQVLLAKEQIKQTETQIKQRSTQLEIVRKRVIAGTVPALNALEIETQLSSDSSIYFNGLANVQNAMYTLKNLINVPAGENLDIETPPIEKIPVKTLLELQPQLVYELALKNLPAQQVNKIRVEAAKKNLQVAQSSLYPTIGMNFNAQTNFANNKFFTQTVTPTGSFDNTGAKVTVAGVDYPVLSPGFVRTINQSTIGFGKQVSENFRQSVGLNINIPIFNNGRARINIERSKIQIQQQELIQEQDNLKLEQDIYRAYTDAKAALQKQLATQRNVDLANQTLAFASKRNELGLLSSFELSLSQNNLFRAQLENMYAKFDYVFKIKLLEFYTGEGIKIE
jgi:outer membrane protein